MRVITIFFLLFTTTFVYSQESGRYYKNKELFKGEAIVFNEKYNPPIKLPTDIEIFTPSEEEIVLAESIFIERFDKDIDWSKKTKNVKTKYWKYNRQYLGYIDNKGNKKIIINLLNFKCRKKAQENFEGWQSNFFVGFGEYYEKNSLRLVANLTSRQISLL